jgi:hypothetical protein
MGTGGRFREAANLTAGSESALPGRASLIRLGLPHGGTMVTALAGRMPALQSAWRIRSRGPGRRPKLRLRDPLARTHN